MAKRHAVGNEQKSPGEVLSHPLRVRILAACTERETAVRQFAEREDVPQSKAEYHFRKLEKEGYIRVGRKEPVRGVYRYLYVATRLGVVTDAEFGAMAEEEQRRLSTAVVVTFHGRCRAALRANTFDSHVDSHFTWAPRVLDEQGWKDQMEDLLRGYERSKEIEAESKARLQRSGKEGIPTTVGLAGFESPPDQD
jgi:DNA-binding transcriptional ArsR family regulator